MASSKDLQHATRASLHRPALAHARNGSHSLITSAFHANHRVTRRKSMTGTAANLAVIAAALNSDPSVETSKVVPIANPRRHTVSKVSAPAAPHVTGSLPSPLVAMPPAASYGMDLDREARGDAVVDDDSSLDDGEIRDEMMGEAEGAGAEQSAARKGSKKSRAELRCDKCGKGYKHSSCLAKHLWEHTPGWSYTSKLLISKHQQVQLLEAASVLLAMNNHRDDGTTPPDSAMDYFPSDPESVSPAASGYSDQRDRPSSAETTPPPPMQPKASGALGFASVPKRYSPDDGFSRSYRSATSASPSYATSVPSEAFADNLGEGSFGRRRREGTVQRPVSSGRNHTGQEDRDLAAAVELLSCSFGSNGGSSRTATLPPDAPPVPPLPMQYIDPAAGSWAGIGFPASLPSRQPESFTRGEGRVRDVRMDERGGGGRRGSGERSESGMDDDDYDKKLRDEDDDGVFGRMEE